MWHILIAELKYNMPVFAVMSAVTVFVTTVQIHAPKGDLPLHMIFFFIMVYGAVIWTVRRNKERRDLLTIRLPIAAWKVETVRICMVCLIGCSQVCLNMVVRLPADVFSPHALLPLFTIWGLYYFLLMLKFSLRNYLLYFMRFNRWVAISKERSVGILVVMSTLINMYLIYLFMTKKESTEVVLRRIISFFRNPVPFTGEYGPLFFTGACLVAAVITVYGYQRRRSFLV